MLNIVGADYFNILILFLAACDRRSWQVFLFSELIELSGCSIIKGESKCRLFSTIDLF